MTGTAAVVPEYLGNRYFARVVMLAVGLHLLALYIWHISPRTQVIDVPVRVLNIKLGDIDLGADTQVAASQPDGGNSMAVENTLSKLVQGVTMRTDTVKPVEPPADTADSVKKAPAKQEDYLSKLTATPRQFVRNNQNTVQTALPAQKLLPTGSASNTEIMRRYEQVISLWIQKFKLYPDEARNQGLEGETVVRIRIDRQGNIRHCMLERSTGHQILDRAAIAMIRRANPVPAVPVDYPPGDQMEFLIPVTFNLQ